MTTHVLINLGSGSLTEGCPYITAALYTDQERVPERCPPAALPPAPELADRFRQYQILYEAYYGRQPAAKRALKIQTGGLTNFSEREFYQVAQSLEQGLQDWLNAPAFQTTYQAICQHLQAHEEIRVILETSDPLLRRLPWQLWAFFEDYPFAELALSLPAYGRLQTDSQTRNGRVRILAIFGNCQGLDLKADRKAIASLPGADVNILPRTEAEPLTREQLNDALWDPQGWDILFFAGHSMTDTQTGTGSLQINTRETLSIDQLRYGLKTAINRGLNLAIFNSCDGLGLAQGLSDLNLPQVIVMREKVPDKVAQKFFTYFLEDFAQEKVQQSLFLAVRNARSRLQGLEDQYPYASWLPVISQNPVMPAKTWHQLRYSQGTRKPRIPTVLLLTLAVSTFFLGVRPMGWLHPMEISGYDHFLQRPLVEDKKDQNIFVVKITSKDQDKKGTNYQGSDSLSDAKLMELLKKLKRAEVRTIGSDILRPEVSNTMLGDLRQYLSTVNNFFVICQHATYREDEKLAEVQAPKSVKPLFHTFSNIPVDPDGIVRRQNLSRDLVDESKDCIAQNAFSSYLAQDYLEHDLHPKTKSGVVFKLTENKDQYHIEGKVIPRIGSARTNNRLLKILSARLGPYIGSTADLGGTQVLLNYRFRSSLIDSFPSASLEEVLHKKFNLEKLHDRIILIGKEDKLSDQFEIPYPGKEKNHQSISGVLIHAHMTSQLVEFHSGRRLIDVMPLWGEIFWVWGWTTIGGLCLWGVQLRPISFVLSGFSLLGGLYLCCWGLFLQGLWVPIVPVVFALVITGGGILLNTNAFSKFNPFRWSSKRK